MQDWNIRKTYLEWDKVLMGPINDKLGVEQGGVNSDKTYKLCNNIQLSEAQRSGLGVDLGAVVVSSIGQADDTVLISECLVKLYCLLHFAVQYCEKYHVELVPEKTKLLAFSPPSHKTFLDIKKLSNHLSLDGKSIDFSQSAEHVGILRSTDGNMPNILKRIGSHTKAINAALPTGMALAHSGNPSSRVLVWLPSIAVWTSSSCSFLSGIVSDTSPSQDYNAAFAASPLCNTSLCSLFSWWQPTNHWNPPPQNAQPACNDC